MNSTAKYQINKSIYINGGKATHQRRTIKSNFETFKKGLRRKRFSMRMWKTIS